MKMERSFKKIHKRVVCRFWLNNTCKKGDGCEFLHVFDTDAMPECRKGNMCADPSCVLNHDEKHDKPLCPNYEAGFCSFGYSCPNRHVLREVAPLIAAQFLTSDPTEAWIKERRRTQRSFRSAPCPYFQSDGWCPYFHACAFSHSTAS